MDLTRLFIGEDLQAKPEGQTKAFLLNYAIETVKNHVRVAHELLTRLVVANEQMVQISQMNYELNRRQMEINQQFLDNSKKTKEE